MALKKLKQKTKWAGLRHETPGLKMSPTPALDSLQEAIIHPPEPCEACFIMDVRALFDVFWTVEQKHPPTAMITLGIARTMFYITLIGFV